MISSQLRNPPASFHLPEEDSITILMCVKRSTQLVAFPGGSGPRNSLPFSLQPLGTQKHLWVNPEHQGFTPGAQNEMLCEVMAIGFFGEFSSGRIALYLLGTM